MTNVAVFALAASALIVALTTRAPQTVTLAASPICDLTAVSTDIEALKLRLDSTERIQARLVAAQTGVK